MSEISQNNNCTNFLILIAPLCAQPPPSIEVGQGLKVVAQWSNFLGFALGQNFRAFLCGF